MKGLPSRPLAGRVSGRAYGAALLAAVGIAGTAPLRAQAPDSAGAPAAAQVAQADSANAPRADSARITHTVRRGETLWALAQNYLSDPLRWPAIYRLNTSVVANPHWIYPGEILRLPGDGAPVNSAGATGADPVDTPDASAAEPADQDPSGSTSGTTVFGVTAEMRATLRSPQPRPVEDEPRPAVRPGEYFAAPWVDRPDGPSGPGRIVAIAEIPGIVEASQPSRLQLGDRAYISLPPALVPAEGDRLLVFATGPELASGRVVIPTGIVAVERASNGDATTVRVVQQFDEMRLGSGVMPLRRVVMAPEARPAPLSLGLQGKILWIPSGAVLPSLQRYVVLSVTSVDGVKPGDQFTVLRPRVRPEGSDIVLPEEPIALVQIVKVTERAATGIILDQRHPAIREGMLARQTARMP